MAKNAFKQLTDSECRRLNELNRMTLSTKNRVAIAQRPTGPRVTDDMIKYLNYELATLGFALDRDVINELKKADTKEFSIFYRDLIDILRKKTGDHVRFTPLFKGFPDSVPLYSVYNMKRIIARTQNNFGVLPEEYTMLECGHFISNELFNLDDYGACPICQMQVEELDHSPLRNIPVENLTPLRVIKLASSQWLSDTFCNIVASNSSVSENDKEFVARFMEIHSEDAISLPDEIPMKEMLAFLAAKMYDVYGNFDKLEDKFTTATDVLRVAAALCDGDVSLKERTTFKMPNPMRKKVLKVLDVVVTKNSSVFEDMLRNRNAWLGLGETLHPGQYKDRFTNAYRAFSVIRNHHKTINTFNKNLEAEILSIKYNSDPANLLNVLKTRPGELGRKIDFLLTQGFGRETLDAFIQTKDKMTTKMLLVLDQHLESRTVKKDVRYFMPKGNAAKMQVIKDDRDPLDPVVVSMFRFIIHKELMKRFNKLDSLGKVYLDPMLKEILVPLQERSASDAIDMVPRGSKLSFDTNKTLRLFTWWKENKNTGRLDVDLSASFYDENWNEISVCSYFDLGGTKGVKHSGDIQSAPNGAAEFIDIDLTRIEARYAIMSLNVFSGTTYKNFECFSGVMEKEKTSNRNSRLFDPTTIKTKFNVTCDDTYAIPVVVDFLEGKMVWADLAQSSKNYNNVFRNRKNLSKFGPVLMNMANEKPNLYTLLYLHAIARGDSVDTKFDSEKDYDTIFTFDKLDMNEILAKFIEN